MDKTELIRIISEMVVYAEINSGKDIYPKKLRLRIDKALNEKLTSDNHRLSGSGVPSPKSCTCEVTRRNDDGTCDFEVHMDCPVHGA